MLQFIVIIFIAVGLYLWHITIYTNTLEMKARDGDAETINGTDYYLTTERQLKGRDALTEHLQDIHAATRTYAWRKEPEAHAAVLAQIDALKAFAEEQKQYETDTEATPDEPTTTD